MSENTSISPVAPRPDGPEMEQAMADAQASFKFFWRELTWEARRIVPGLELAAVKAAFNDPGAGVDSIEHMWMSDVRFDGDTLNATMLSSPNALQSVRAGDEVTLGLEHLEDWMYVIGGRVYGGFTIQEVRAEMSRRDRRGHDAAWGLEFPDPGRVEIVPVWDEEEGSGRPGRKRRDSAPNPDPGREHPMAESMAGTFSDALGQDPDALRRTDDRGFTELHHLALGGSAVCVIELLRLGADPHVKTETDRTPRQLAEALGWSTAAETLRAAESRTGPAHVAPRPAYGDPNATAPDEPHDAAEHRDEGDDILDALAAEILQLVRRLYGAAAEISPLVFAATETSHPDWDDAAAVFAIAAEQFGLRSRTHTIAPEIPLLFVGWHQKSPFVRGRQSMGFVLTDRRLYSRGNVGESVRRPQPLSSPIPIGSDDPAADCEAVVASVVELIDWAPVAGLVDGAQRAAIERLLVDAMIAVTRAAAALGIEPDPSEVTDVSAVSTEPRERCAELGLSSSVVKFPSDTEHRKHLAKVATKFVLGDDPIVLAITDGTLAGVYGMVVTDDAIVSRDVMEKPVRNQRSDIDPAQIVLADTGDALTFGGNVHTLPAFLSKEQKNDVIELLRTILDSGNESNTAR